MRTPLAVAALLAVAAVACAHPREAVQLEPPRAAPRFAASLAAAFEARDAGAIAAQFAPDADLELVGDPEVRHGRAAVQDAARELLAFYSGARLTTGRIWIGEAASVVELVFSGTRDAHAVGAVGAAVVTFDAAGLARTSRVYIDVPTLIGQVDPSRLPKDAEIRAPVTRPPGDGVAASRHTAIEAANLAAAAGVWTHLDAHDAAGTLAPSSEDYVYDDFAGPAPLDKPATQRMVARFLGFVPDFAIASKPTFFAAGDDVVTESVEHMTARGQPVVLHGLDVKHFAGGRVAREWQYANGAEALERLLGVVLEGRAPAR